MPDLQGTIRKIQSLSGEVFRTPLTSDEIINELLAALVEGDVNTDFFVIDNNGQLSLKNEYLPNGLKYDDLPKALVIPDSVDNISVSSLADNFLESNRNIKAVSLPEELTEIPEKAFAGTDVEYVFGLEHITTIGEMAFAESRLKEANLTGIEETTPSSIGNYAFYKCYWLDNVTLNNEITSLPIGCFCRCIRLNTILGGRSITKFMDGCLSNTETLSNANEIIATLSNSSPITLGKSAFVWTALPFDWSSRNYADDTFVTSGSSLLPAELDATAYQKWNGESRGLYSSWQTAKEGLTDDVDSGLTVRTNQYYMGGLSLTVGAYLAKLMGDNGWITTQGTGADGACFYISTVNIINSLYNALDINDIRDAERKLYAISTTIDAETGVVTTSSNSSTGKLKTATHTFNGATGAARTNSDSVSVKLAKSVNLEWERYYLTDDNKFMYHSSAMARNNQSPVEYQGGYSAFIQNVFYQNIASGKLLTICCLSNTDNLIDHGRMNGHNHVINVCGYKSNGDLQVFNNMYDRSGNEYSGFTEYIPPEQVLTYYNEFDYFWKGD